jgi:hypothetical protein
MTAQFPDAVQYQGKEYNLAGIKGDKLFEPQDYGLNPVGTCTACWRGFVCHYVVNEDLRLDALFIGLDMSDRNAADSPALLNGIQPTHSEDFLSKHLGMLEYPNINLVIPFTGGLLLGEDFIKELYVHMGFHPAWKYREVWELLFVEGILIESNNRSLEMEQIRQVHGERFQATKSQDTPPSSEEIKKWIERCFSRDYE